MECVFGPVLSRRLGLSMGVDLLKHKTCNLDCVYCELGRTARPTPDRGRFVSPEKALREILARKDEDFDHLTFAGSGEPTLSVDLGEVVCRAREMVDVPVAVITNSTLLVSPTVRAEVAAADIVLPTLDAATQTTFQAISRPEPGLRIEKMIEGLRDLRREFSGEIWLEVMLVKGVNDHEAELIAEMAESIDPDRIQLNTVVRTPAEPVEPLSEEEMQRTREIFQGAELIPDWDWSVPAAAKAEILDLLSGSPCTIEEVAAQMKLTSSDAIKYCKILERDGLISRQQNKGRLYFHVGCTK